MAKPKPAVTKPDNIPFIDLQAQRRRIASDVEEAALKVIRHGTYIMGPEVKALEQILAGWAECEHVITCANGTDALGLALMARNAGPGDAVFVPAFTFVATAEVVAWLGATPYFVDVKRESFNLDPESLERAIGQAKKDGLKPAAVIPVDLFGQPADYPAIKTIADEHDIWVLADAAQSFGARLEGKPVGSLADITTTSFFPAKPLGCYGDGGAIFTNDADMAERLRSLRIHGKGSNKYDNVRIGMNGRLDTIQAAILLEKIKIFADELQARQRIAERYNQGLDEHITAPRLKPGATSSWAQYTVILKPGQNREAVISACRDAGVPTAVYYPVPLSRQKAYAHYPAAPGGLPVSESLSQTVLSLPMHPYLAPETQDYIISVFCRALTQ